MCENSRRGVLREIASVVSSAKEALEPPAPPQAPARQPPRLTDPEIERYSRQLVLPEWG